MQYENHWYYFDLLSFLCQSSFSYSNKWRRLLSYEFLYHCSINAKFRSWFLLDRLSCNIERRCRKVFYFLITSSNCFNFFAFDYDMSKRQHNIWHMDCIFTTCRGGCDCAPLSMNNVCAARNACSYQENPSILWRT